MHSTDLQYDTYLKHYEHNKNRARFETLITPLCCSRLCSEFQNCVEAQYFTIKQWKLSSFSLLMCKTNLPHDKMNYPFLFGNTYFMCIY